MMMKKKGQIWVETVLYTLIGLALIGLILGFATPRINESKDKIVIDQTISALNELDAVIAEVSQVSGNTRTPEFTMKRGELFFNKDGEDKIVFILPESKYKYSEPNVETPIGRITVLTKNEKKPHEVILTLNYNQDLRYDLLDDEKKFTHSPTPYTFSISSKPGGIINIEDLSRR
jgi:type II secretory pathway pseudopilin PulG